MISKDTLIRPGMTAIAAVIALSSTPLLAQDAAPQTAPNTVPTQVAPPTVVPTAPSTAVPTTVTPPTAVTPPAATTIAPQPTAPVIDVAPTVPVTAEPVETTPPVAATAPERPARTVSPRAEAPRPAASQRNAAPAPAAPVEAQPVTPPAAVEATPVPVAVEASPVQEAAPPAAATVTNDDTLPLVGAGALAVLALGAAGFALSRRRRRDDVFADETVEAEPMMAEPAAPLPAPAFAREAAPAPVPVAATAATLPNGFDISRHGRHVQTAYRGPTPDNPFVSLKKRLTRAHFYDMQEARAAETGAASTPQPAASASRPVQDRFQVVSPAKGNVRTGTFRPAFQN